ncbi:MAG TPA: biotin carboxylase N-terminal domain-containing protein [bacterium]|nr:biotin carboxylase N-terminal domain-containing protein [bacterium]
MAAFRTLLIANRGEIAVRIARTARALGYRTVAVYSDADADALHVRVADEAVRIGPASVGESYLDAGRVLAAARRARADAVHPGYGFLSENANFAAACVAAGLVFVGPPAEAIRLMGDKRQARARMEAAGVPVVPGYHGEPQDDAHLAAEAERIGYSVMVKAAAGGGGRGMRRVSEPAAMAAALQTARAEAETAFGNGALLLERALDGARHVEVQVFADAHGAVLHLGERDCSLQRRHQKVVEESPSPALDAALRERMGAAAVQAAREIGYVGAGTVEFLLAPDGTFHFLEMNTRLQVEHPVTEALSGLDLVAWQLRVAAGEPLPLRQEQITLRGHAIEARLYAEDAYAGFLPRTGRVLAWRPPQRDGVRVDHGLAVGTAVGTQYDALLAKVIAWGAHREEARRRLLAALEETELLGVETNRPLLMQLLEDKRFVAGAATTRTLDELMAGGALLRPALPAHLWVLAAVLLYLPEGGVEHPAARWALASLPAPLRIGCGDTDRAARVTALAQGRFRVMWDERESAESAEVTLLERAQDGAALRVRFVCDAVQREAVAAWDDSRLWLACGAHSAAFQELQRHAGSVVAASNGLVTAPMGGRVLAVQAREGECVRRGTCLIILEAMKLQHELAAACDGVVRRVAVHEGDQVTQGQVLLEVEPSTEAPS